MSDEYLLDALSRHRIDGKSIDRDAPVESMLPNPGTGYECYARAANKPVYTLHCVLGRDGYRSFQYVHLDSDSTFSVEGKGQLITLRFAGTKTTKVKIRGRNLWRLYDYIHQHRTPWLMRVEPGRDFAEDDEPVITAIEFEEVKEIEPV